MADLSFGSHNTMAKYIDYYDKLIIVSSAGKTYNIQSLHTGYGIYGCK